MTQHPARLIDSQALIAALYERSRNRDLPLTDLIQVSENLMAGGAISFGVELYKNWLAFNSDHPQQHLVYFNLSVALRRTGDISGSINALIACLQSSKDFGPAKINLGRAFEDCGRIDDALGQWREFLGSENAVDADKLAHSLTALQQIGRLCEIAGRLTEAEKSLWQAIELRPDKLESAQHWIAVRQRHCVWPTLQASEHVTRRQLLDAMSPISLASYCDDPMFQLAKAHRYGKSLVGRPDAAGFVRNPVRLLSAGQRLRVGYVSSDLRSHAVGFALSEVMEYRDSRQIEAFAYCIGEPSRDDETQDRLKKSFDHWVDVTQLTDRQAAERIVEDGIDILIDVNGYTKFARTAIFAYRPAPVIVNWCGYPGTMGTTWHNYLIADERIVPPGSEIYFSEKLLHVGCNQPIDRKRAIDTRTPTRHEAGLPDNAFVYASMNGMQKITERCFSRWMRILSEVPGSVLWLLCGDDDANQRLRGAANARGIDEARIMFAPKAANPQHLSRIALADLFLDTAPYGAHSTAADALTMGLPVLTLPGRSFASRFCSSIVAAAGVPELICESAEDYIDRAIAFGRTPSKLTQVRQRLQGARESCVLRDIPSLARRLEDLFWQMQREAERGETPAPNLTNLDVYYEIGAELADPENDLLDEEAYRALYRERLEAWNYVTPIPDDGRFWSEAHPRC